MLSTKNVLPNFLKTVIFVISASLSMSAFANDVQTEELKDLSAEESTVLKTELTTEEAQAKAEMEAKIEREKQLEEAPLE